MKSYNLLKKIGLTGDKFIVETKEYKYKNLKLIKSACISVFCVALVVGAVLIILFFNDNNLANTNALADVVFPKSYTFDSDENYTVYQNNPVNDAFFSAINEFSYKTTPQIITEKGNLNYSPLSLYYALALTASGAGGKTADEIFSLLGVSDKETLYDQCGSLYRRLYVNNNIGKLKIGNSLWMDKNINWNGDFIKNAAENFYAHSYSVDFSEKTTGKLISDWIANSTNGSLNPEINTSPEQVLSIINTIYFYDEWTDKFDKGKTAKDVFHVSDTNSTNCDYMNMTYGSHYYAKGEDYIRSVLGLKNAGSMVFILPNEGISPRELLADSDKMREIFDGGEAKSGEVVWKVPKFSFSSEFDLAETLKSLGLNSMFKADADFSGITSDTAFVSGVRQETHIAIDENGVEASAFTKLDYAGAAMPDGRAEMILNRPFIYGITSQGGTLLFVGICENPAMG